MTPGIQAWLDAADDPLDLYDLVGSRCLDPDRDQLLRMIDAGISALLPHRDEPRAERAGRVVQLLQELHTARETFGDPRKAEAYDQGLIRLIRAECEALPASEIRQTDALRRRLERDFRVHPRRVEGVVELIMSNQGRVAHSGQSTAARPAEAEQTVNAPSDEQDKQPPTESGGISPRPSEPGEMPRAMKDAQQGGHSTTTGRADTTTPRPPRPAPRAKSKKMPLRPRPAGQPPPSPISEARRGAAPTGGIWHDRSVPEKGHPSQGAAAATVGSTWRGLLWGLAAMAAVLLVGVPLFVLLPIVWQSNDANQVAQAPVREAGPTKSVEPEQPPAADSENGQSDARHDSPPPAASATSPDDSTDVAQDPPRPCARHVEFPTAGRHSREGRRSHRRRRKEGCPRRRARTDEGR